MTVYPKRGSRTLSDSHRRMLLEVSGISPDVLAERGTYSARRGDQVPQGGGWLPKRPGTVFPVHTLDGDVFHRLRLDSPRSESDRYRQPKGRANRLDVHPRQHARIREPGRMRFITEGEKKVDAGVSRGLLMVGLSGVWNGQKGKELIPDWEMLPLEGENYCICFDSDILTNPNVQMAADRQARLLQGRGAKVYMILLPPAADGSKQGLDDFFAAGGTVKELRLLLRPYSMRHVEKARLTRDEALRAHVADLEMRFWESEWKGVGGASTRDVYLRLIEAARRHGKVVGSGAGVRVEKAQGPLALEAKVSTKTLWKALRRLEEWGLIRRDNEGRKPDRRGAFVLFTTPRAKVSHYENRNDAEDKETLRTDEGNVTPELQVHCRGDLHLRAPRLRWSQPKYTPRRGLVTGTRKVRQGVKAEPRPAIKRLGKIRGAILDALDAAGGTLTLREIADILHQKRPRDMRRRNLPMLEDAGIIQVDGDTVSLADNWLQALEKQRLIGKEIEAEELAERRYKIKSRAYHSRHEIPKSKPSAAGVANIRASREKRRAHLDTRDGDPAASTPTDAELVAMRRRVERLVREGMARRFAEQEVYGAAASCTTRSDPPTGPPDDPMKHLLACECLDCSARAPSYARAFGGAA